MDNLEKYRDVAQKYKGTEASAAIIGLLSMVEERHGKSPMSPVYKALGWDGGTIHQIVSEIKMLKLGLLKDSNYVVLPLTPTRGMREAFFEAINIPAEEIPSDPDEAFCIPYTDMVDTAVREMLAK